MTRCRLYWIAGLFLFNALGLMAALLLVEAPAAGQHELPYGFGYRKTDLNTLGGNGSIAKAIDEEGQVVGFSDTPSGNAHAFFYDGNMHDLGTLQGGDKSGAVAINDSGRIFGYSKAGDGKSHVVAWDWESAGGQFQVKDLFDLGPGIATGLNARGDTLFTRENAPHSSVFTVEGNLIDVPALKGKLSQADAINALRQIAGSSQTAAGAFDAFLWKDISSASSLIDLSAPNGAGGAPFHINNEGEVAGSVGPAWNQQHPTLFRPGQPPIDLTNAANPYHVGFVTGMNDVGEIALSGVNPTDPTVILGPNLQVEGTLEINPVVGMNNAGQLLYNGPDKHAYLLTPMGGKALTGPETDQALGEIRNLKTEFSAAGQAAQGPAQIALLDVVVPDLDAAETHLGNGFTLGAAGELKAILRIIPADVPAAAGGTPERIDRLNKLFAQVSLP